MTATNSDAIKPPSFTEIVGKNHRTVIAYMGSARRRIQDVQILPWQELIRELDEAM